MRATPTSSSSSPRPRPAGRSRGFSALLRLVRLFGLREIDPDAAQRDDRPRSGPSPASPPRRTGAAARCAGDPTWRSATCSAPHPTRAPAPPPCRRATRTTSPPRPAVGSRGGRCASSCASSATATSGRRRSRTPASSGRRASSPPEPVAVLTLPQGDITTVDALAQARDRSTPLAFNPWNTTDEFRPLGNLNRARKAAYDASAAHRLGNRWESPRAAAQRVIGGGARRAFSVVNRYVEWHRLPRAARAAQPRRVPPRAAHAEPDRHRAARRRHPARDRCRRPRRPRRPRLSRTYDGSYNDLSAPAMGAVGAAFGRNLPPVYRAGPVRPAQPGRGQPSSCSTASTSSRRGR